MVLDPLIVQFVASIGGWILMGFVFARVPQNHQRKSAAKRSGKQARVRTSVYRTLSRISDVRLASSCRIFTVAHGFAVPTNHSGTPKDSFYRCLHDAERAEE
jgi:hypothetical protein